jgi:dienelactone hydrolase
MELRPGRAGALVDSPDGVVLTEVPPGARVRIAARLELGGVGWECSGEYTADRDGEVETAVDASSGGSYSGMDPYGLFWSATLHEAYDWSVLSPMRVTLRASCDEMTVDASYSRALLGEGVVEHPIAVDGVAGRLFLPAGTGTARAVVLLAGSDGGPGMPPVAALLASHGLPALSLAHWRHPGTPDVLRDIDVEVVARACAWLRAQDRVADEPPAVLGYSRGGELALLAASLTPEYVGPVASVVGSGVPWGAWGEGTDVLDPAWRLGGEPVAQMAKDEDDPRACLDDADMVAAAEIPVERATGPVLLLSGEDDQMWPSTRLSRIAEARAEREGAADRVTHVA